MAQINGKEILFDPQLNLLGGGGGVSAETGQVTVEASDWVAGDAFGAYRAIITLPTQMDYADTVLLSRTTVNDPHITFAGKWGTDTPTVRISALKPEKVTFGWTVIPASATGATQGAVIVSAISQDEILKVDWATLKGMRDSGKLAQGKQYRITDYVATTTQDNTQSAGHAFDLIVTADTPNTLNENARAVLHDGDTYFANCKLSAWEIKYSLDNDKTRFWWADDTVSIYTDDELWFYRTGTYEYNGTTYYKWETTDSNWSNNGSNFLLSGSDLLGVGEEVNFYEDGVGIEYNYSSVIEPAQYRGKGVIFYMKDEYDNECPYDFKNIQFKRWATEEETENESICYSSWENTGGASIWCYTFNVHNMDTNELTGDASIVNPYHYGGDEGGYTCFGNVIKEYSLTFDNNEEDDSGHGVRHLNNIVLYGWNYGEAVDTEEFDYNSCQLPCGNTFGYHCLNMTLGHRGSAEFNSFGAECKEILMSNGRYNTLGDSCWLVEISGSYNTLNNYCTGNKLNECNYTVLDVGVRQCVLNGAYDCHIRKTISTDERLYQCDVLDVDRHFFPVGTGNSHWSEGNNCSVKLPRAGWYAIRTNRYGSIVSMYWDGSHTSTSHPFWTRRTEYTADGTPIHSEVLVFCEVDEDGTINSKTRKVSDGTEHSTSANPNTTILYKPISIYG